jgi:hypothetical protein
MSNFFIRLNVFVHRFLVLLGLRGKEQHWGVVYDSATKQPLDPVLVTLVDAKSAKIAQSGVTDIAGRYNFLAYPGKFKILLKKSNYTYPSKIAAGGSDQIYKNLYHGEFFELPEDSEVIPFNIPMDAQTPDWNQSAKSGIVKFHPFEERLLSRLMAVLFWFLFVAAALGAWFSRSRYFYIALGIYAAVFLLALIFPRPRRWGRVRFRENGNPAEGVLVELSYREMPDIVIAKAVVYRDAKFLLRANPGKYMLRIVKPDGQVLASRALRVGSEQAVNLDFAV